MLAVCFLLFRRTEKHAAVAARTVFLSVMVVISSSIFSASLHSKELGDQPREKQR